MISDNDRRMLKERFGLDVDDIVHNVRVMVAEVETLDDFARDEDGEVIADKYGETPGIDVRLQCVDGDPAASWCSDFGSWAFHTHDASLDHDHRGFWGSSSVGADMGERAIEYVAEELIDQVLDMIGQSPAEPRVGHRGERHAIMRASARHAAGKGWKVAAEVARWERAFRKRYPWKGDL